MEIRQSRRRQEEIERKWLKNWSWKRKIKNIQKQKSFFLLQTWLCALSHKKLEITNCLHRQEMTQTNEPSEISVRFSFWPKRRASSGTRSCRRRCWWERWPHTVDVRTIPRFLFCLIFDRPFCPMLKYLQMKSRF
jgi:hypothetical protein